MSYSAAVPSTSGTSSTSTGNTSSAAAANTTSSTAAASANRGGGAAPAAVTGGIIKPFLASPGEQKSSSSDISSSLDALVSKHSFPEDLEKSLSGLRKEEHDKRIKALRKELDFIANTDWKYQPVEDLPGH